MTSMSDIGSGSKVGAAAAAASSPSAPTVASAAAAASSRYTYVVTAQPPTLVTHTAVCAFTGEHDRNLVLVRGSRLELYRVSAGGSVEDAALESLISVPLYARIASIVVFRGAAEHTDRICCVTERHKFFVLKWDAKTKSIDTIATGDSKLKIGRVSDQGCLAVLDPSNSVLGLHQYASVLQVLNIDPQSGTLGTQIHECKLDQLQVIQMAWLYGQTKPTLVVLCVDGSGDVGGANSTAQRRIRSYTYEAKEKELRPAPHAINVERCEPGAAHIIATKYGGTIIVAEEAILYIPLGGKSSVSLVAPPFICTAVCQIDPARYLLGDIEGGLHVLLLTDSANSAGSQLNASVTALKLEYVGVTSIAQKLQYVDHGLVMVGSIYGDSQLIRLSQEPVPVSDEAGEEEQKEEAAAEDMMDTDASSAAAAATPAKRPNFITIVQSFPHLGPIVDFAILDLERNGQGAMMTCSGAYKDGSLRIVRNGIGVREEADIELPGIQGVWSLKESAGSEFHKMLVQTFATETRILALEPSEDEGDDGALQLAECEIAGFDAAQRTLYCANVGEMLLQVTQSSCRLVDAQTKQLVDEWRVPAEVASGGASANITVASANSSQVLLAAGRVLMILSLAGRKLRLDCHTTLDQEISCLDVTPLGGAATASFVAVCMWHDYTVRVLRASTLEEVSRERLGETVARSVLFAQFEGAAEGDAASSAIGATPPASYLMCGLGDGNLISFELQPSNAALSGRKKLAIGTSGLELRSFVSRSSLHVFASCDRPTVISCAHGRLLYSNVNSKTVSHMAPFNAETVFQDCLALVSSSRLLIAHMDEIQRLHISKVKTGGQPRRLAHHAPSKTVAVVVVEQAVEQPAGGDPKQVNLTGETHKIKLYEEESFRLAHEFTLGINETGLSIASLRINTQANVAPAAGAAAAASSSSAAAAASPAASSSSSAATASFPEYLVVGTAFLNPDEAEPSSGRLLVLEVVAASASPTGRPQLRLVCEQHIKGGAWTIDAIQGRIIAGINARVVVYRCITAAAHSASSLSSSVAPFSLDKECDFAGGVMVLQLVVSRNQEYVFVGDMMKSVSILRFNTASNANGIQSAKSASSLEEVVRDYDSAWLTALASFSPNDDVCIYADHHFNLVTLRRPIEAATEEDRARLECVGKWHAGEMINKIGPGSLIMQLPNEPSDAAVVAAATSASSSSAASASSSLLEPFDRVVPTHLYGTLSGSIGVLAPLTTNSYKFFARLEEKIEVIINGVGNLSHKEWRAFHSDRRTDDSQGFIDGDVIESFMDLPVDKQELIAQQLGLKHSECVKRVEDVMRIH